MAKQHADLADPRVVVLDLSSPLIEERDIAATLYGPMTMVMADPATAIAAVLQRQPRHLARAAPAVAPAALL